MASEPSFAEIADADPDEALAAWEAECAHARELVAAAPSLDAAGDRDGRGTFSLRWVLVHLIEEYARHNGHADLLRESLRYNGARIDATVMAVLAPEWPPPIGLR